ncbi:MAG: hypothetical protein ABIP94_08465, partial [Planctomycetota bacterium]
GGGPRPGAFAVRITCGDQSSTLAFRVLDRRGTSSVIGSWPGINLDSGEESYAEEALTEEQEEAAEAEQAEAAVHEANVRGR